MQSTELCVNVKTPLSSAHAWVYVKIQAILLKLLKACCRVALMRDWLWHKLMKQGAMCVALMCRLQDCDSSRAEWIYLK